MLGTQDLLIGLVIALFFFGGKRSRDRPVPRGVHARVQEGCVGRGRGGAGESARRDPGDSQDLRILPDAMGMAWRAA